MVTATEAPPPTAVPNTASDRASNSNESSKYGTKAFEKLAHRSPAEIAALKGLWLQVLKLYRASTFEMRRPAFQDVGALLTMSEPLAREILQTCLGVIPRIKKKAFMWRTDPWEKAKVVCKRMEERDKIYVKFVETVWTVVTKKKSSTVLVRALRSKSSSRSSMSSWRTRILQRDNSARDRANEGDSIEDSAYTSRSSETAPTSLVNASTIFKRLAKNVHPRTRFANGLGQLGINEEADTEDDALTASTSALQSELSTTATSALGKLSSRTPPHITTLKSLWTKVQELAAKESLSTFADRASLSTNLSDFLSIPEDTACILSNKLLKSEQYMGKNKEKLSQVQWEHMKGFARRMERVSWPHFYAVDKLMKEVVRMRKAGEVEVEKVEDLCLLLLLGEEEGEGVLNLALISMKKVEERREGIEKEDGEGKLPVVLCTQAEMMAAQALVAMSSGQDSTGSILAD